MVLNISEKDEMAAFASSTLCLSEISNLHTAPFAMCAMLQVIVDVNLFLRCVSHGVFSRTD
jgi:hypothetical protein